MVFITFLNCLCVGQFRNDIVLCCVVAKSLHIFVKFKVVISQLFSGGNYEDEMCNALVNRILMCIRYLIFHLHKLYREN